MNRSLRAIGTTELYEAEMPKKIIRNELVTDDSSVIGCMRKKQQIHRVQGRYTF